MGILSGVILRITLPQKDKRLLAIVETDGCFSDGVAVATNCWVGRRTMRVEDYGKVAATFVDVGSGYAVRIADRVASTIIPLAMTIALAAWFYWGLRVSLERGLMVALAVLLITCPCALGIAIPLALWRGLGEAANRGILIRSAEGLKNLAKVNHIFFDKTGTLTTGNLTLSSVIISKNWQGQEGELFSIAASLGSLSTHPVAKAIAGIAAESKISVLPVREFRSIAGLGLQGKVEGMDSLVYLGSRLLMDRTGLIVDGNIASEHGGKGTGQARTVVYLGWGAGYERCLCYAKKYAPRLWSH